MRRCAVSRAPWQGDCKDFAGTDQDIRVRKVYRSVHYGEPTVELAEVSVWRVVWNAFADWWRLQNDGIEFNGVTLLSSILNYNRRAPG
jgi:hypothetical protein